MKNAVRSTSPLATLLGLCILLLLPLRGTAQVDQGAITGIVRDTTGAVIPDARITLTDTDTNLVLQGTSDNSGNYVFSPLKIGKYQVSATASGFSTSTQENIQVDAQARLNIIIARAASIGVATPSLASGG